jgi:hypothetical protein
MFPVSFKANHIESRHLTNDASDWSTVIITISRESLKGEKANDIAGIAKAGVAITN